MLQYSLFAVAQEFWLIQNSGNLSFFLLSMKRLKFQFTLELNLLPLINVKTECRGKIMLHHIRRWFNNLWISDCGKSSSYLYCFCCNWREIWMEKTCFHFLIEQVSKVITLLVSIYQVRGSDLSGTQTILTEVSSWFSLVLPGSCHSSTLN